MTEAQWLVSEDPAAMLDWVTKSSLPGLSNVPPSDRKLRLFACAVERAWWIDGAIMDRKTLACVKIVEAWADGHLDNPGIHTAVSWLCDPMAHDAARYTLANRDHPSQRPAFAALLREIVGNPFRPVTLPKDEVVKHVAKVRAAGSVAPGVVMGCSWLTPTVLLLAQVAYDERKRKCNDCRGKGGLEYEPGCVISECSTCHGTGTINDGTLDPFRLALVADALEEAGCTDEGLMMHLRGKEQMYGASPTIWQPLPGPHVRGCWALDLILGKE